MSVLPDEKCTKISEYTEQLIKDNGYPLEIHHVTTEDGYINSIYRIPYSPKTLRENRLRFPVLLVHGLTSSVAESVQIDRHLGYYLAENGFDVWMANCRGTTYSRGHVKYNHVKDAEKYWNFSFHEIGYYDHPAFIDYILKKTRFKKVFYIGISQGTTTFTILTSTRPEYNEKIALACLLCPAVLFKNAATFPMRFIFCYIVPWIKWTYKVLNKPLYETPLTNLMRELGQKYAKPNTIARTIFIRLWDVFAGHRNPNHNLDVDATKISITTPNSAAFKQFLHYSQIMTDNKFTRFNYGSAENLEIYGSDEPPWYKLGKITAPIALFYSKNDMFYGTKDIDNLAEELGNCVFKYMVEDDMFTHMDFLYNNDVISLLYMHVVGLMKKYRC